MRGLDSAGNLFLLPFGRCLVVFCKPLSPALGVADLILRTWYLHLSVESHKSKTYAVHLHLEEATPGIKCCRNRGLTFFGVISKQLYGFFLIYCLD